MGTRRGVDTFGPLHQCETVGAKCPRDLRQNRVGVSMAKYLGTSFAAIVRAAVAGRGGFKLFKRTRCGANGLAVLGILGAVGWGPDAAAQGDVVSISDAQTVEGMDLVFQVSTSTGQGTAFGWQLGRGTAKEGVDYRLQTATTMTIDPGQRDARIVVPTVQDGVAEADETVVLVVSGKGWTEVAVGTIVDDDAKPALTWDSPLVIMEGVWIVFLLLLVVLAKCCNRFGTAGTGELRGLNLPRGSVRAILALFAVGSFVIVMVFGGPVIGEYYETVLAAFGSLTGSIIGFYFGNRGASTAPAAPQSEETQKLIEEAGGRFGDEGAQAVGVWMRLNPGGNLEEVRRAIKDSGDVDEFKETLGVA